MSGTHEYYFEQRWIGLDNLAKILGNKNFSRKSSSIELSLGEQFQDLSQVIENILGYSDEIHKALLDKSLSEDAFCNELNALEWRVKQAIASLNEELEEIQRLRNRILISVANQKIAEIFKLNGEYKNFD